MATSIKWPLSEVPRVTVIYRFDCIIDCYRLAKINNNRRQYSVQNPGEGGTPPKYLYGYVPPNRVIILGLLIYCRMGYAYSRLFKNGVLKCTKLLERSIKNWPISRKTLEQGIILIFKFFLKQGPNLETWAAYTCTCTHPKHTRVPSP